MKIISLGIILLVGTIVSTAYLYEVSPNLDKAAYAASKHNVKCVYDIAHEYLPNMQRYYQLYDIFFLIFLIPLFLRNGTYDARAVGKDILYVILPMLAFRCITICATVPTATTLMKRDFGHPIKQLITGMSHDTSFSGHTAVAIAIVLVLIKNGVIGRGKEKWVWIGALGAFGLFSTTSRSHYTNDVLYGYAAAILFYDFAFCSSGAKQLFFPCKN